MVTYTYLCGCRKEYAHLQPTKYGAELFSPELCGNCWRQAGSGAGKRTEELRAARRETAAEAAR